MAKVQFKRIEDSTMVDDIPIIDGQFVVSKDGKIYVDYGNTRTEISGTGNSKSVPIGTIIPFGGPLQKIPNNWLECNGQAVSRETYSELFSIIGTYYGVGDGETTFNLPTIKNGKTLVGTGGNFNLGITGGEQSHVLTPNELAYHQHKIRVKNINFQSGSSFDSFVVASQGIDSATDPIGGNVPHNNMPPYVACNFIIKALNEIPMPKFSEVVNEYSDSATDTYSCDYVNQLNNYSTEEKAIGKWIDGRTIYRKTIDVGEITGTYKTKSTGVNADIYWVLPSSYGLVTDSDIKIPIPFKFGEDSIEYYITNDTISIKATNVRTSSTYMTIEYVKAID